MLTISYHIVFFPSQKKYHIVFEPNLMLANYNEEVSYDLYISYYHFSMKWTKKN